MTIAKLISLLALSATIVPSLLAFADIVSLDTVSWAALAGTVVWFIVTPFWMGRQLSVDAADVEI